MNYARPIQTAGHNRVERQIEFFTDNLLVRVHFIIEMIWWTGLASWELEFSFPGRDMGDEGLGIVLDSLSTSNPQA